jgi:hypothetical protein
MRRLIRIAISLATLAAITAVTATAVAAGNYAETSIIGGGDTPPTAGEERELRLLLMQHGITPVDHGSVELTASLPGTDETVTAVATSVGDGVWVATVTFPAAGDWQLRVLHSEFETPPATTFAVDASPMSAVVPLAGSIAAMLIFAAVLILAARRMSGGRAASEPTGAPARGG